MIRHGETGLLFRVGDEAHLRLMLKEMMDRLDEHRTLGQNARQWVAENYAIERTVENLMDLYGSLVKKDSGL
ncbi:MAG TPA: hypothetical protein PKW33_13905 [Anaerolineaceae bacterium]|nr:hypothetical protein [Anaerolineaceae bacterium]HPN52682.1 hypothetical protein [Anaerolineaceae bacterium]